MSDDLETPEPQETETETGDSEAIEISPDSLIRIGDGEPVRFSEYKPEGHIPQDEWTRKTQQLAKEREQLQQQYSSQIQQVQQLQQQLMRQQQGGASQGQQQQTANALQTLLDRMAQRGGYANQDDFKDYHQMVSGWAQTMVQKQQRLEDALRLMYQQHQKVSSGFENVSRSTARERAEKFVNSLKGDFDAFQDETGEMLLRNLVDSYVPAEGESEQDFQAAMRQKAKELAGKIDSFAEGRMKTKMKSAQKAKAAGIPTRGGSAAPSGALKASKDETPEQMAKRLADSGFFE